MLNVRLVKYKIVISSVYHTCTCPVISISRATVVVGKAITRIERIKVITNDILPGIPCGAG